MATQILLLLVEDAKISISLAGVSLALGVHLQVN